MDRFFEINPSAEDYWRSIVLFGRNVASYKFALAKSLLELAKAPNELIRLEDLAEPFSRHIAEHLKTAPKQATSVSSRFLDACRQYNAGDIERDRLIETAVRRGFNNVIDAFHVVNQGEVPIRFFLDERRGSEGIRLTDELFRLRESGQFVNLPHEVEARWRLVETAWEMNIARNLVAVEHDAELEMLFASRLGRRVAVTSSRSALNGYQKGRCFYCFADLRIDDAHSPNVDVDHFFPHILKGTNFPASLDGVWNLVLACQDCNRGEGGKFARVPAISLLERLKRRNDYLISSHHPLRETLMRQTGATAGQRHAFLQRTYTEAHSLLIHTWEPQQRAPAVF